MKAWDEEIERRSDKEEGGKELKMSHSLNLHCRP